jgi:hypothetical protein
MASEEPMIEDEQRTWSSPETVRRLKLGTLWATAILLLPACFIYTGHPILWPQWTRYFFVFGLPYVICIAIWVYPGKRDPEEMHREG